MPAFELDDYTCDHGRPHEVNCPDCTFSAYADLRVNEELSEMAEPKEPTK